MIFPADSVESLSPMPSSLQPSPASSLHTAHVANSALPKDDPNTNIVSTEEIRSESEFLFLPDYLILSNCETGRLHHTRYAYFGDSFGLSRMFYSVHRTHTDFCSLYLRCAQRTQTNKSVQQNVFQQMGIFSSLFYYCKGRGQIIINITIKDEIVF